MAKYFGQEMILGTYFLNVWLDSIRQDDIQEAFKTIQKNPIKTIPTLVQAGVNSTNEINGKEERISFMQATLIVDENGKIGSDDTKRLIEDLANSLGTNLEGKQTPKAKRSPKK